MNFFGYHFRPSNAQDLADSVEGAIKYLAPLGVNHLVIEINNAFKFVSHPEISCSDITAEDLKTACDKLKDVGIEVIPLYNCIGHQGWDSRNSFLKAYPEFDEAPHIPDEKLMAEVHERVGDKWLATYTPAWCCNEPKIYDVILPALDELVEATNCKTIHLGMDEIFLFGQCERCKGMKPADLFRDALLRFYNYFNQKGIKVMIWGDRLLNAQKLLGEDGPKRARYTKDFENVGSSDCIDQLPKDIILCDWHYDKEEVYPSAHELMSHGYTIIPSCWYKPDAAESFWDASVKASKTLDKKELLPGMLVTGWQMRNIKDLFTLPKEELSNKEQSILETFKRVAKKMKEYN